jgi:hypothetical protein
MQKYSMFLKSNMREKKDRHGYNLLGKKAWMPGFGPRDHSFKNSLLTTTTQKIFLILKFTYLKLCSGIL